VVRLDGQNRETQKVRLVEHPLPSGEVLVIGRSNQEIEELAEIVGRALALGLLPAFALAVAIGMGVELACSRPLSDVNRESNVSLRAICASACRPAGAMTRSTSSPSASIGCWARLKVSS